MIACCIMWPCTVQHYSPKYRSAPSTHCHRYAMELSLYQEPQQEEVETVRTAEKSVNKMPSPTDPTTPAEPSTSASSQRVPTVKAMPAAPPAPMQGPAAAAASVLLRKAMPAKAPPTVHHSFSPMAPAEDIIRPEPAPQPAREHLPRQEVQQPLDRREPPQPQAQPVYAYVPRERQLDRHAMPRPLAVHHAPRAPLVTWTEPEPAPRFWATDRGRNVLFRALWSVLRHQARRAEPRTPAHRPVWVEAESIFGQLHFDHHVPPTRNEVNWVLQNAVAPHAPELPAFLYYYRQDHWFAANPQVPRPETEED